MRDRKRSRPLLPPLALAALAGVMLLDASLIALHIAFQEDASGLLGDPRSRLSEDRGFGEWFGGLQLIAAGTMLLVLRRRTGAAVFTVWAIVLAIALVDDLAGVHEQVGRWVTDAVAGGSNPGVEHLVEAAFLALVGTAVAVPLALTHKRADAPTRQHSVALLLGVIALGVAAVGLDAVASLVTSETSLHKTLRVAEDGGELIAITMILFAAVYAWFDQREHERRTALGDTLVSG